MGGTEYEGAIPVLQIQSFALVGRAARDGVPDGGDREGPAPHDPGGEQPALVSVVVVGYPRYSLAAPVVRRSQPWLVSRRSGSGTGSCSAVTTPPTAPGSGRAWRCILALAAGARCRPMLSSLGDVVRTVLGLAVFILVALAYRSGPTGGLRSGPATPSVVNSSVVQIGDQPSSCSRPVSAASWCCGGALSTWSGPGRPGDAQGSDQLADPAQSAGTDRDLAAQAVPQRRDDCGPDVGGVDEVVLAARRPQDDCAGPRHAPLGRGRPARAGAAAGPRRRTAAARCTNRRRPRPAEPAAAGPSRPSRRRPARSRCRAGSRSRGTRLRCPCRPPRAPARRRPRPRCPGGCGNRGCRWPSTRGAERRPAGPARPGRGHCPAAAGRRRAGRRSQAVPRSGPRLQHVPADQAARRR